MVQVGLHMAHLVAVLGPPEAAPLIFSGIACRPTGKCLSKQHWELTRNETEKLLVVGGRTLEGSLVYLSVQSSNPLSWTVNQPWMQESGSVSSDYPLRISMICFADWIIQNVGNDRTTVNWSCSFVCVISTGLVCISKQSDS